MLSTHKISVQPSQKRVAIASVGTICCSGERIALNSRLTTPAPSLPPRTILVASLLTDKSGLTKANQTMTDQRAIACRLGHKNGGLA
ncbi:MULTISPECIES: hypothetical protein [unclassified Coleofasciculus]|uniref:hypothetical protein n=1 Tax=unclassified Coleofasciculus TaxID=2692782 RepID=UPI001882F517|nr:MULTISPECIES: hypothetical protein [unclassified Coleofasciculus]MBE9125000.1 hypothetical protein [Coleofasciculus sp. LEGE 07081]MBE9147680.1 hypothetical protein [Coleofasciculus sp. LEGE 07092]